MIKITLDTCHIAKAIKTMKFPIPTPMELWNKLMGRDRFSVLSMRDLFFQFEMDEESSKLYTFWTIKVLYNLMFWPKKSAWLVWRHMTG